MAKLVQTNLSMTMTNKRLEPDFFINDQKMKVSITNCASVISFCQYGTSKDLNDNGVGFPILRLNEFDGYFVNEYPSKTCSYINQEIFESLSLKKGDLLVCRTNGNPELVGKTAIVLDDLQIAFASYLFRIRTNDVILPEVMLLYLNSSHGRNEIRRHLIRNNQSNFSPAKLRLLNVPLFSSKLQLALSNFVQRAYRSHTKSKKYYEYATSLFIERIGFATQSIDTVNIWVQNLNDILNLCRLDPEFWKPNTANKYVNKKLIDFVQPITTAITIHQDSCYNYIEIGDIDVGAGDVTWTNRLGANLPANAKISVSGGELIISKVRPTRGAIAIIPDGFDGICSSAFVVGKIESPYREVIQVFLRSDYGKMLLGRPQKGSSYPTITDKEVLDIDIPIIEMDKMNEISVLVQQSHQLRRESKRLLEVAKKTVEIAIEESEERAMQYLNENQATNIEY